MASCERKWLSYNKRVLSSLNSTLDPFLLVSSTCSTVFFMVRIFLCVVVCLIVLRRWLRYPGTTNCGAHVFISMRLQGKCPCKTTKMSTPKS